MGGGKKGAGEMEVTDYRMSIHYGICHGPIDQLKRIIVGEKVAWSGIIDTKGAFEVRRTDLFGGPKKEGGVQGIAYYLPGGPTQTLPEGLATRLARTSATAPAYRTIASVWMVGSSLSTRGISGMMGLWWSIIAAPRLDSEVVDSGGFYWTSNNPYLKGTWFEVTRTPKALAADLRSIRRVADSGGRYSIYLALDTSTSMGTTRIADMKGAANEVLDLVGYAIAGGATVDVGLCRFASTATYIERPAVTTADIADIRAFIATIANGQGDGGTGTGFTSAITRANAWFGATSGDTITSRSFIILSDGDSTDAEGDAAAVAAEDLLNRLTGTFSTINSNPVDVYAIGVAPTTTVQLAKIDNMSEGQPGAIDTSNYQVLVNAASSALGGTSAQLDANPAAIIYECLTNTEWGMGGAVGTIDTAAFTAAAETLAAEQFGLSMQWTKQSTIEDFVSEVLDHIQATIYVNPRTGLLTITLIRGDYNPEDLPTLDETSCHVTSFDRKGWGETINEIVATWTNPANEQEETVAVQNLANIAIQGAVVSDSRNYYGVRTASLALKLAARDLATASSPLATFEVEADRSAWDFVPGGVFRLNYPEYGIAGLALRIAKVDYGKVGDATVKLSCMEDIFANPVAAYEVPSITGWVDPAEDPAPLSEVRVITAPLYFVSRIVSTGSISALEYPEVVPAILASQDGTDTKTYELIGQTVQPNGEITAAVRGTKSLLGHVNLLSPLAAEATSTVASFGTVYGGPGPRVSGFLFIGNKQESGQEIAMIQSSDGDGWHLSRGVFDTVPRAWDVGTTVWFVSADSVFVDAAEIHSEGEAVVYKMLSVTSRGTLEIARAPAQGITLTARPWLPNRPANVIAGGVGFGTADLSGTSPTVVTVTWSNRNRTLEDAQVLGWTEAGLPPETGQTTTIRLYDADGDLLATHSGLTGETFDVPVASFGPRAFADFKVTSVRDGLESLQGHVVRVKWRNYGWNDAWGQDWGGGTSLDPGLPDPGDPGTGTEPPPDYEFPDYPWWNLYGLF